MECFLGPSFLPLPQYAAQQWRLATVTTAANIVSRPLIARHLNASFSRDVIGRKRPSCFICCLLPAVNHWCQTLARGPNLLSIFAANAKSRLDLVHTSTANTKKIPESDFVQVLDFVPTVYLSVFDTPAVNKPSRRSVRAVRSGEEGGTEVVADVSATESLPPSCSYMKPPCHPSSLPLPPPHRTRPWRSLPQGGQITASIVAAAAAAAATPRAKEVFSNVDLMPFDTMRDVLTLSECAH